MPLPSFRSKGAYGIGIASCTAALPTGTVANDILLIVVESTDSTTAAGTPDIPSGWTRLFEETQGAGATNVTTLTVFGKRHSGSESNVLVSGTVNHVSATMLAYSGCVPTGTAWQVGAGNGGTNITGTITGLTTPENNCLVIAIAASTQDANSTTAFASWTNPNLSNLTEREDNTTNTGAGGGIGVADGGKATAGATGNTTVVEAGATVVWRAVHVALKPLNATTYEKSVSISRAVGVSDSTNLSMSLSTTLASFKGLSDSNNIVMNAGLSLGTVQSVMDGNVLTLESLLIQMQKSLSISEIAGLSIESLIGLARSEFISTDYTTISTFEESINVSKVIAGIVSNDANLFATISLAQSHSLSPSVIASFLSVLSLQLSPSISLSSIATSEDSVVLTKSLNVSLLNNAQLESGISISKAVSASIISGLLYAVALSLDKSDAISSNPEKVITTFITLNKSEGVSNSTTLEGLASLPVSMKMGIGFDSIGTFLTQIDLSKVHVMNFVAGRNLDVSMLLQKISGLSSSSVLGVVILPGSVIIIDTSIMNVIANSSSTHTAVVTDTPA